MKKTLIVGVALAASVLTACSSGNDGIATTSSSAATTSSSEATLAPSETEDVTTEDMTTEDMTTGDTTTGDADATVEPVTLDEQSVAWFSTFCSAVTDIQVSSQDMTTMKPDLTAAPADQQELLASGVAEYGQTFKTAAADIASVPAATVDGGEQLAAGAAAAFDEIGDAMIGAAEKFAATPVSDLAGLQSAATTLGTDVQAAAAGIQESLAPMESILTPELGAAVEQIPGCEDIAGS